MKDKDNKELYVLAASYILRYAAIVGGVNHVLNRLTVGSGKMAKLCMLIIAFAVADCLSTDSMTETIEKAFYAALKGDKNGREENSEAAADC